MYRQENEYDEWRSFSAARIYCLILRALIALKSGEEGERETGGEGDGGRERENN